MTTLPSRRLYMNIEYIVLQDLFDKKSADFEYLLFERLKEINSLHYNIHINAIHRSYQVKSGKYVPRMSLHVHLVDLLAHGVACSL